MVTDVAHVASRLSWRGALVLGAVAFSVFYWLLPMWIHSRLASIRGDAYRVAIEHAFARRIHWLQMLGVAMLLVCLFFATRSYVRQDPLWRDAVGTTSWISRLIARLFT